MLFRHVPISINVLTLVALTLTALANLAAQRVVAQSSVVVEVQAGDHDHEHIPLTVTLPPAFRDAKSLFMQRLDNAQQVTAQRTADDPATIVWMLQDRLTHKQVRRYRVLSSNIPKTSSVQVTCQDDSKKLTMSVGDRPVLTYHTAVATPPPEFDPIYRRSGFIHPLTTPAGRVLTADFPFDHVHQHGLFFAWPKTTFEGRKVDFWNQKKGTGTVEHVAVTHTESGPVFAQFDVTLRHRDLSAPEEPKAALNEEWSVRLYPYRDQYVFDLTSRQTCASVSPLLVNEYKYGGMAFRGTTDWLDPASGFDFLTSGGQNRVDGNHTRPTWVEGAGLLDGQPAGFRIIPHPDNFRAPQPVRLHPTMPYFVFSPEVLGEFSFTPGETRTSRYRYIVFDAKTANRVGENITKSYLSPPTVRIIESP